MEENGKFVCIWVFILMSQLRGIRVSGWAEESRGRLCEIKVNFPFLDFSNSESAPTLPFFRSPKYNIPTSRGETRAPRITSNIENFAIIVKSQKPLTIVDELSILDAYRDPCHASAITLLATVQIVDFIACSSITFPRILLHILCMLLVFCCMLQ